MSQQSRLYKGLRRVGARVYKAAFTKRNTVQGRVAGGTAFDRREFRQDCEVAVFEAFIALGGDVEAPGKFDWSSDALFTRALAELEQDTRGKGSAYHDAVNRLRPRADRSTVAQYQWTAWRQRPLGGSNSKAGRPGRPRTDGRLHTIDPMENPGEDMAGDLIAAIKNAVGERDADLVRRFYLEGETLRDMARAQVGSDDPVKIEAARANLSQRLRRIRHKCATLLDASWRERCVEATS